MDNEENLQNWNKLPVPERPKEELIQLAKDIAHKIEEELQ